MSNASSYIFDMDGTLTPPAGPIEAGFASEFLAFMASHRVILVSGSEYDKMEAQLGADLCRQATAVFPCQASQAYADGQQAFSHKTDWPHGLLATLATLIQASEWPCKFGDHIQDRGALINCSVPGRLCLPEVRKYYTAWDLKRSERLQMAAQINELFPELDCTIGGQISVDITRQGDGKHKLLDHIENGGPGVFFGDTCQQCGNDYSLAQAVQKLPQGLVHQVDDWQDTARLLKGVSNGA